MIKAEICCEQKQQITQFFSSPTLMLDIGVIEIYQKFPVLNFGLKYSLDKMKVFELLFTLYFLFKFVRYS